MWLVGDAAEPSPPCAAEAETANVATLVSPKTGPFTPAGTVAAVVKTDQATFSEHDVGDGRGVPEKRVDWILQNRTCARLETPCKYSCSDLHSGVAQF